MNEILAAVRNHPGCWLNDWDPVLLQAAVTAQQGLLRAQPQPYWVLRQRDPEAWLIEFLAALATKSHLVVVNPEWGSQEWLQVEARLQTQVLTENAPIPQIWIPSGGSSGSLKWIPHTQATLMTAAQGFQDFWGIPDSLVVLPLFHVSGLLPVLRSLVAGGHAQVVTWSALRDPSRLVGRCLSLVPTQLQRLLHDPQWRALLPHCRLILLGGAPPWESLIQTALDLNLPLALSYGMTETAAAVAVITPTDLRAGWRTYQPLPHAQITVVAGDPGQIVIQSAAILEGTYPTEDLGRWDPSGRLAVVGRRSTCVITGGEKVFPAEVEAAIRATQGVEDVWVGGIPDTEWGERLVAAYVPGTLDLADLLQHLRQRLAPYKIPKTWLPLDGIPRTPHGKINQQHLRSFFG